MWSKDYIKDYILKRRSILVSYLVSILFFLILIKLFTPYNETNDDKYMQDILTGAFGVQSSNIVFQNIFVGRILSFLYVKVAPDVNWYVVSQMSIILCSFIAISFVVLEKVDETSKGLFAIILFQAFFSPLFYLVISFSRISAISGVAGYLLILLYAYKTRRMMPCSKTVIAFGLILLLISSMIRFKMFLICSAFAAVYVICDWIDVIYRDKTIAKQEFIRYCMCFIPCFAVVFGIFFANQSIVNRNQGWSDYQDRRSLESYVYMYGWPDYEEYNDIYLKYGISKESLAVYSSNLMEDDSFLPDDALIELGEITRNAIRERIGLESFMNYIMKVSLPLYYLLLGGAMIVSRLMSKRNYILCVFGAEFAVMLMLGYYLFVHNWVVNRIMIPSVFACFSFAFISNEFVKSEGANTKKGAVVALVIFALYISISVFLQDYRTLQNQQVDASGYYNMIETNKDKVYVADHAVDGRKYTYQDAYTIEPFGYYDNFVLYGGWMTGTPIMEQAIQNKGIDNISDAMLHDECVFFLTKTRTDLVLAFLQEHYAKGIATASIYDVNPVCRVVSYNDSALCDLENAQVVKPLDVVDYVSKRFDSCTELRIRVSKDDIPPMDSKLYIKLTDQYSNEVYRVYQDTVHSGKEYGIMYVIFPNKDSNIHLDIDDFLIYVKSERDI